MKILNKSLKLLAIVSTCTGFIFIPPASANESFSTCVENLDRKIYIDTAIDDCQDIYKKRFANESFSTCVENLDRKIYIDTAIDECKKVFRGDYLGETFSTCVENLDRKVYIDTARKTCKTVLNNAKGEFRQNSNRDSGTTTPTNVQLGGDPQAIADCVKKLMYERKPVCTRRSCARLSSPAENADRGFGGWQWQTVRTDISESAAAQACQNAR